MPAIGITGGIATGKSTFCGYLREILPTARFFNADEGARELINVEEVKHPRLLEACLTASRGWYSHQICEFCPA